MSKRRVAIVAGGRTPFVKAGKTFKDLGPFNLASHAVRGLVEGHGLDPASIEAITYWCRGAGAGVLIAPVNSFSVEPLSRACPP